MARRLRWWIPVAFLVVASADHLSDLLGGEGGAEEHVQRVRDALYRRLRCGVQQGMTKKLCEECLSAKRIFNMTTDDNETAVQQLGRTSVVLLNYLLSFQTSCTAESVRQGYVGSCWIYEQCWSQMQGYMAPMRNDSPTENLEVLEKILREVKPVFEPDPTQRCFSAEMVLNELNTRSERLDSLSRDVATVLLLTSHLYSGECIDVGESVADFLDDIFLHYGNGCERVMTQSGFTKLWNDLQMQRRGKHIDHGVQKSSCSPHNPDRQQEPPRSSTSTPPDNETVWIDTGVRLENSTTVLVLSRNGTGDDASHVYHLGDDGPESGRRAARHTPFTSDHEHKNLANECLPSDDLLQRFLTPGNQVITSSEFLQLCPALVQQAVSGVCSARLMKASSALDGSNRTDVFQEVTPPGASPWLAVASVSLITAASLLGLFLLPVLKKSFFVYINSFFTGLAFGTMSGDVVLHIMPQYLGLHQHNEEEGHSHDDESALDRLFPSHLQRQLAFLLTMYLLFLVECLFEGFAGETKEHHGHSHGPVDISLRDLNAVGDVEDNEMKPTRCTRIAEFLKPSNLFSGISSKAAVIVLADTVHNFADGMAIAVGFSTSYKDGVSTSVAVFFHELPHEIGDFAVLMNCGLGYWRAFVFNLLSGLSAFLGLGVGVFTATLFRDWLLCITAGLFFFVVMGEMLPDMRLESREKWKEFAVKVTGTVMGILTMICIAMYELSAA